MEGKRVIISRDVAANVLHHYRGEGWPGGSFFDALIKTFALADDINRLRLALGFPEHDAAITLLTGSPDGIDKLREIVWDGEEEE